MHVVATAGHVDHGKSALVRSLTGMEPDRWAEERQRGLTIDLGFAWTELPDGERLAFVDVPGHGRFISNMLAGVGQAAAAVFVVAANEGWMPQSTEHLAVLDVLGVRDGILVITKTDLAEPARAMAAARAQLSTTSLAGIPAVAVSTHTGDGLPALRRQLAELAGRLSAPSADADVRLWIDRAFVSRGSGTIVTGTLTAGRLTVGDEVTVSSSGAAFRIRSLQEAGIEQPEVRALSRVGVNLRGATKDDVHRGAALLNPATAWSSVTVVDVQLQGGDLAEQLVLHLGSAAVAVRLRRFDPAYGRLVLSTPLPLRVGDLGVLRDPSRALVVGGARVLDVSPPDLGRRRNRVTRAAELAAISADPVRLGATARLRAAGFLATQEFRRFGLQPTGLLLAGDWRVDESRWSELAARAVQEIHAWEAAFPLAGGMPLETFRDKLRLPTPAIARELIASTVLVSLGGRVGLPHEPGYLPAAVDRAVRQLEAATPPFEPPSQARLGELGLGPDEVATAERAGRIVRLTNGMVLPTRAFVEQRSIIARLPQPFTVAQARDALGTTRRSVIPLLEHLDRLGFTERRPDGTRRLRPAGSTDDGVQG